MPTYQYRCTSCETDLEVVQSFTDDPLTKCPDCKGDLRKVYSAVGVVFKGSGFYATDNRAGAKAARPKPEGAGADSTKTEPGKAEPAKTDAGKESSAKSAKAKPASNPGKSTGSNSAA